MSNGYEGQVALFACKQILELLCIKGVITRDEFDEFMRNDITEMDEIICRMEWKQ